MARPPHGGAGESWLRPARGRVSPVVQSALDEAARAGAAAAYRAVQAERGRRIFIAAIQAYDMQLAPAVRMAILDVGVPPPGRAYVNLQLAQRRQAIITAAVRCGVPLRDAETMLRALRMLPLTHP